MILTGFNFHIYMSAGCIHLLHVGVFEDSVLLRVYLG